MPFICFNGKIVDDQTPLVPAANRGLRYGDGIFETMRWYAGNILFANEHFARLWHGMQLMQFQVPVHFSPEHLLEQVTKLIQKNGHQSGARIRLQIVRSNGGLYDPENHHPQYIIETWPLAAPQWNINGLETGFYEECPKTASRFSGLKSCNALPYLLGALHAKQHKWNDAIIVNQWNRCCETTIANLFIIKDQQLITPSLKEGCVAGIIRHELIHWARSQGIIVKEEALEREQLLEADELFTTNAIHLMRWVKQVENHAFQNRFSKELYQKFTEHLGM